MEINIKKIEKIVEIAVLRNKRIVFEKCKIFLNKFSSTQKGEESILEFLDSDKDFIPTLNLENEEFSILSKDDMLGLIDTEDIDESNDKDFIIHFGDNLFLDVTLPEVGLSMFRSRPIDYFNSAKRFIELKYFGRAAYFNLKKIEKVTGV
ncbi:MAG: hypothetical protein CR982_10095 [Candidatus Cloacimonadota bacterium]|nr:MAG: hypothetical protein CR982_10095 [Candidatus Cloacimonadota bacterium]PIE77350.1 MAG: hypothetical protein CSA15_13415 [Candidatus Delongbacteria bacterium]